MQVHALRPDLQQVAPPRASSRTDSSAAPSVADRSAVRMCDITVCSAARAIGGGFWFQSRSTRRSTGTARPGSNSNTASASRSWRRRSGISTPVSDRTSTGPSSRNSTSGTLR
ncbi:hypothetical protein [Phytohabitans rumicis]|uniref:hypothetical protein n=1 Tax=Phytohabitans rumicis TaxID=1076125 RepID=UPI001C499964|nr:hypothetical protein [Phytohabitans rumicis]